MKQNLQLHYIVLKCNKLYNITKKEHLNSFKKKIGNINKQFLLFLNCVEKPVHISEWKKRKEKEKWRSFYYHLSPFTLNS